jgi:hypothetical protein
LSTEGNKKKKIIIMIIIIIGQLCPHHTADRLQGTSYRNYA